MLDEESIIFEASCYKRGLKM